ncbi:MAG: DNA-3-methyladenine glycosylase [Legionellales bacterium]|nr:DNA-3-methyladenine glycosylase [Legionellales bacterium]
MLKPKDFNKPPVECAIYLLGKRIKILHNKMWLSSLIIETEAYDIIDKASHASLGFSMKKKGLFMPPGTIYMYYARGKDSLNISCKGRGNAVLIKSGYPYRCSTESIQIMQSNNPINSKRRDPNKLCSGQTLLCKSLNIKLTEWDQKTFCKNSFYIEDSDNTPKQIIQTKRLGIPKGRDEHLMYRFIHLDFAKYCTSDPTRKKNYVEGIDYNIIDV